jgi:hypothetical protein
VRPAQSTLLDHHLAAAQAETDPAEWQEAWSHGATLSLEQITAEILETRAVK